LDHVPKTIADGLRTRHIGERNLTIMSRYVADMVTVSEEAIVETMRFLWERLKIIVEPSAAVALAPLFTGTYTGPGQRSGVLLSGGNVDFAAVPFLRQPVESAAFATAAERKVVTSPPDAAAQAQERPRVLVGCAINEESLELLQQVAEVDLRPNMDEATLQGLIGGYHGLIVGDETHVSGLAIEYGFNLRVIGCTGARLDNIDVSAARALGVEVRYSPGSNAVAVAEHTLGLLLSLSSRVYDEFGPQVGQGLAGKTLGLVGYGRIGRQVAKRAAAFDMRVLVNQPRLTPELALGRNIEVADLPDLLRQADFISLNVPFKAETDALLGRRELAMMKPQACLVNMTHTELVDDEALLAALNDGRLAGAALASFTPQVAGAEPRPAAELRAHPRVIAANHLTAFRDEKGREAALTVASQVVEILTRRRPNEALSLEVVSTDQVTPHEATDDKRVLRLMDRLEADGRLVNPPIVTVWENRYVILDGATRFTALARLGYPHIIVQVVPADSDLFALHTWYHAISSEEPFESLLERLRDIAGLSLVPMTRGQIRSAFSEEDALCYLLDRQGRVTLAQAVPGVNRLTVMNALVDAYSDWGTVERTLLTDLSRLLAQFPKMAVVAIFPQFTPETVFRVARRGDRLPAGLTRFVIPGRILRLNADLSRLRKEEPLTAKRAWFNRFLEDKLARSRLRYYQEPVILLDE
jgi:phosphoglycerate dehydrogenase-like enzyme